MTQEQGPTREGLKVNALLERIAVLENEKADLRVDFTVMAMENERLRQEVERLTPEETEADEVPKQETPTPNNPN